MPVNPLPIRRGVPADAPRLAAFAARTFFEAFGADNRPEDMQAYLASAYGVAQQARELADQDVATLLVHRDDALVAYAQVRRSTPPPCVTCERPIQLRRFYVERTWQGQGIAQALMHAVRDAAGGFDGRHIWLGVWERNLRALAFYRKEGFVDVGGTDFFVGPDRQIDRVLVAPIRP
jgi:ribosomal protein S18 acetylase RimI-like enzyme